jgi:hypothetical protein
LSFFPIIFLLFSPSVRASVAVLPINEVARLELDRSKWSVAQTTRVFNRRANFIQRSDDNSGVHATQTFLTFSNPKRLSVINYFQTQACLDQKKSLERALGSKVAVTNIDSKLGYSYCTLSFKRGVQSEFQIYFPARLEDKTDENLFAGVIAVQGKDPKKVAEFGAQLLTFQRRVKK